MSETTPQRDRRAQWVCLAGLLIQAALAGAVFAIGLSAQYRSDAVLAAARHLSAGVPIWLVLLLVFRQRRRSRLEDLETDQLKRAQSAGLAEGIFDVGDEAMLLERRRLNWTMKFVVPAVSVLLALKLVVGTAVAWSWSLGQSLTASEWHRAKDPFIPMVFLSGTCFACFVFGRYVIGMARQPEWRLLRAGGSFLLGNALSCMLLVVAMAFAASKATAAVAEPLAAYVIRAGMFLLGLEIAANFILEFYRPRRAGEEIRPAFDSRLLALFSEPGGVVRSIAQTANYQFGFEVSATWFYKLLERSVFPLASMTMLALILLSGVVILDVDEQAIVERLGRRVQTTGATLGPGLHFKWPWPVDRVVRTRVDTVRSVTVGASHEEEEAHDHGADHDHHQAILWTEAHESLTSEMLVVVASPQASSSSLDGPARHGQGATEDGGGRQRSRSVAVSLLMISAALEYQIKDFDAYNFNYQAPDKVLEAIAYQELSDSAAGVDQNELMGAGREAFGQKMGAIIQQRADELGLGVKITFVALQDAHPPSTSDVAKTFQNVVSAEIRKQSTIEAARGAADRILTLTAGRVDRAQALDDAILTMDRLATEAERLGTADAKRKAEEAAATVQDLLVGHVGKGIPPASGQVAAWIAGAEANRSAAIASAQSKSQTFQNDLAAYEAAPHLFEMRRYLTLLGNVLPPLRKYVFTGEPSELIVDYQTKQQAYLDLETSGPPQ